MTTASVIFASLTGNNEEVAEWVITCLRKHQIQATQFEMSQFDQTLLETDDIAIIVPYTYGEGDLPEEGLDLYDAIPTLNLSQLTFGVAGSGDEWYGDDFCRAVTLFDTRLSESDAHRGASPVCIDLRMDSKDQVRLAQFVTILVETLKRS